MKNLAAVLLLISSSSFAQSSSFGSNPGVPGNNTPRNFHYDYTPLGFSTPDRTLLVEILNSPFVEEDYQEGTTTIHGKKGFSAKMRYNAAKDVIEFKDDDAQVKELLRRPYISAKLAGKQFLILKYLTYNKEKLGYFNPLNEGDTQLLYMPKKKLEISGYRFQEKRTGVYKDVSAYYIKYKENPAININLNKAAILKQLDSEYEKVLNYYISENDLKLRKKEDVIRLLTYYNSLLAKNNPEKPIRS